MSRPLSQLDLEAQMLSVLDALEDLVEKFDEAGRNAAEAEANYRSVHARAYLSADEIIGRNDGKLAVKSREIYADHVAEDAFLAHKMADAVARYTREALWVKRSRLEVLRSINSNLRPLVGPSG